VPTPKRGFVGLEGLISNIGIPPASGATGASLSAPPARGTQRPPWEDPNSDYKPDRDTGPVGVKVLLILIVVGVLFALFEGRDNSSSPTTSTVPSPTPPASTPSWSPPPGDLLESRPLEGTDRVLNANEIAYCLAEGVRIDAVKPLINPKSNREIDGFNEHVSEFNIRCAQFRYRNTEMNRARAYVAAQHDTLVSEVQTWPSQWRQRP
jgi:hypothetical protein